MDEYIDILDNLGNFTGETALKSIIHQKGYYHHTAHVWFYTKNGEVLLAQRSSKKTICPLIWDVSVAGHIDAGETPIQAAIRETQEEIGLTISETDLEFIGVFESFKSYQNGIIDNEFNNTFIAEINQPLSNLTIQEEEVEAIKLVTLHEFKDLIAKAGKNNHLVSVNQHYYEIVRKHIEQKLS